MTAFEKVISIIYINLEINYDITWTNLLLHKWSRNLAHLSDEISVDPIADHWGPFDGGMESITFLIIKTGEKVTRKSSSKSTYMCRPQLDEMSIKISSNK